MWWDVETTFPRETTSAKSRPSDKFVSSCLDGARPLFSGEQSEWLWLMFGCQGNDRMGSLWGFIWAPVFTIGHLKIAIVIVSREKNQSEKFSHLQYVIEVNR